MASVGGIWYRNLCLLLKWTFWVFFSVVDLFVWTFLPWFWLEMLTTCVFLSFRESLLSAVNQCRSIATTSWKRSMVLLRWSLLRCCQHQVAAVWSYSTNDVPPLGFHPNFGDTWRLFLLRIGKSIDAVQWCCVCYNYRNVSLYNRPMLFLDLRKIPIREYIC